MKKASVSHSVVSYSVQPHGLQPTKLLCPRNFPGKNTQVGCHSLLQGIFPIQRSNPRLLHCRQILYCLSHQGSLVFPEIIYFYLRAWYMIKWSEVKVTQSCPTLWDPIEYTVHGIVQARILEWTAFPFFSGSSQPRDRTQVSHIAGRFFTSWATREAQEYQSG